MRYITYRGARKVRQGKVRKGREEGGPTKHANIPFFSSFFFFLLSWLHMAEENHSVQLVTC